MTIFHIASIVIVPPPVPTPNIIQILFLSLLQGVTELFPISSLGHTVILPGLFGWGDIQGGTQCDGGSCFLPLIVALHLGTSIAATFLVINGSVLFTGELLRRKSEAQLAVMNAKEREARFRHLASLSWKEALIVGSAQALALIPGFSRSGMTIVAGLGVRLTHEDAARYSFLLGTPIILAAALIEVPLLFTQPASQLLLIVLGMIVSGVAAYFSTKFLMKHFETGRLDPFAYYCWIAGIIALVLFFTVFRSRA